ncbi:cytochrome P450 [Lepidopterella palustris CBS 459.81]|uniref:Cytochrome P450 n=1 Tax=Lepidopterella palustris CBS 459.81 TaxID=1314670 RepID=A0A8E2JFZ7_9PEZI|nr:cytochrome P450 [Lepidopterella palustris CBS 459.81]
MKYLTQLITLRGLAIAAISLLLKVLAVCFYRLTYHPLAKYPGPWLAKLTDWYAAYHAYKGDLQLVMCSAHEEYGDIVRFGPNRLLFNSSQGLHDIYHSKHVKKSKGYLAIIPAPGAYSVHTSIDKAMHRHKRRVLTQGLSDDVLRKFEPTLMNHIHLYIQRLMEGHGTTAEGWTPPKNMTPYCDHLTFDVMGEFGFGRDFEMQIHGGNHFLIDAIAASNVRTSIYAQFPELAKFKLEKILYPNGCIMRQKFLDLTCEFAKERVKIGKDAKQDLFSFVIDFKNPETGKGFTLPELWSENKFLVVAGSDTSSTVLASTFFYLTHYPECYSKLIYEVRTTFKSADEINSRDVLMKCTYLKACIHETMRMSPPAGGAMWREVEEGGTVIDGEFIPAGFDVGTSMYAIHHNEAYYPDSYTYRPERWIISEDNTEEDVERVQQAFNPFSLGPRGCVGRGLAYMEISDTIAMVVWNLDFKKPDGPLGRVGEGTEGVKNGRHRVREFQLIDHLTSVKDGPYIEFRPRKM